MPKSDLPRQKICFINKVLQEIIKAGTARGCRDSTFDEQREWIWEKPKAYKVNTICCLYAERFLMVLLLLCVKLPICYSS